MGHMGALAPPSQLSYSDRLDKCLFSVVSGRQRRKARAASVRGRTGMVRRLTLGGPPTRGLSVSGSGELLQHAEDVW